MPLNARNQFVRGCHCHNVLPSQCPTFYRCYSCRLLSALGWALIRFSVAIGKTVKHEVH